MPITRTDISKINFTFSTVSLSTLHPFGISYGSKQSYQNIVVRLEFQDHTGFGEASPARYHGETLDTVLALFSKWEKEDLFGDDPFAIAETMSRLDNSVSGHNSAKAAVEMAMHDLCGKIAGQPTYKMLGLSGLPQTMTDFTIGLASIEEIEKKTQEALNNGYKILKVKQGTERDKEIIKAVRRVAKDIPIRVDANGGWTAKQAIAMSHFLAEQNVQFIEQPLPKTAQVSEFKLVRDNSPLPIFADECICRSQDVARFAGAIDGVVVKLMKTGGLLEALKVIHTARAFGMQVMLGCMIESSLGITAATHISALCDHLDLDGALLLADDPFVGAVYEHGYLRPTDKPGLGVCER